MSASVRYTIDLAEIDRAFAEARRRAGSLRGLHGAIGEVLLGAVRRNFETSGDGKWAPLKPATLMARAQSAVGSGKLFKRAKGGGQTLTAGAARAVANAKPLILSAAGLFGTLRYVADESGVEAGSNKVYAAHQFFGSLPGWRWNIPARNPLYLKPEDEGEIERMYVGFFGEALR